MNVFKNWVSWVERKRYKKMFNIRKKKPTTKGAFGNPKVLK